MTPNAGRHCNAAGRQIIEDSEDFEADPYPDANGIPTQGYGHTKGVSLDDPSCSMATADAWLEDDLADAENAVGRLTQVLLSDNQFSALSSFTFNVGEGDLAKGMLLAVLNEGRLDEVPKHLVLYDMDRKGNVLPGLVTRRQKEVALWNTPDSPEVPNDDNAA